MEFSTLKFKSKFHFFLILKISKRYFSGPEVLFTTCVAMKFVDDDDDDDR